MFIEKAEMNFRKKLYHKLYHTVTQFQYIGIENCERKYVCVVYVKVAHAAVMFFLFFV